MIKVSLNGKERELPNEIDLNAMVDLLSFPGKRIAIELNKRVVRRSDWPQTTIENGDQIEVVHFVGGG